MLERYLILFEHFLYFNYPLEFFIMILRYAQNCLHLVKILFGISTLFDSTHERRLSKLYYPLLGSQFSVDEI